VLAPKYVAGNTGLKKVMDEQKPQIGEEIRLIPMWSVVVAALVFAGIQYVVHVYLTQHQHNMPPFGLRLFWSLSWGTVLAFFTLMVGYVTRDAKRRGMTVWLWTMLVIFMPGAIGLVVYFLLRQPLSIRCPQCSTHLQPGFNFCPQCHFQLAPTCRGCQRTVRITDTFCGYCGERLVISSHANITPARY
jgi:Double zinc ribbon